MGDHRLLAEPAEASRIFEGQRRALFGVAYRIVGQVADAEDVVQEAWLRWARVDRASVDDPRAFLVRVVTHLALDRLRRRKARREAYIGPWLPEPLLTSPDPTAEVERAELVSLALLVVLETLSPLERAVFVLREAFGYSHAEVAAILGRSESAVRQLAHRARQHVEARRPRFLADPSAAWQVAERFLAACQSGDLATLLEVLAPDVTLVADGGGQALAPRRPLHGAEQVGRFLLLAMTAEQTGRFLRSIGLAPDAGLRVQPATVNGQPGVVASAGGKPVTALVLSVVDERVQAIYLIANPDKLVGLRAEPGP